MGRSVWGLGELRACLLGRPEPRRLQQLVGEESARGAELLGCCVKGLVGGAPWWDPSVLEAAGLQGWWRAQAWEPDTCVLSGLALLTEVLVAVKISTPCPELLCPHL